MNKNVQVKVVLIFFILGIILISGLGINYLLMLKQLETISYIQENLMMMDAIIAQITQTKMIIGISISVYAVISALVGYFVAKVLVSPMRKLIKSAEKIASGENIKIEKRKKDNSDVGDLTNAFSLMTEELEKKLKMIHLAQRY